MKYWVYLLILILTIVVVGKIYFLNYNTAHNDKYYEIATQNSLLDIVRSLESYKSVYGRFPKNLPVNECEYNKYLLYVLLATTSNSISLSENPKGIIFIEPGYWGDKLNDAWGRQFHVKLNNSNNTVCVGEQIITNRIAVWSDGKNGKNEYGNGDDICSWGKLVGRKVVTLDK